MKVQQILQAISKSIQSFDLPATSFSIERPQNDSHGDYASNFALVTYPKLNNEQKKLYSSPKHLAEALVTLLNNNPDINQQFSSVIVAGPGFINFTLNQPSLIQSFNHLFSQQLLVDTPNTGKTAIIEYSSPNIAKPFTIGHLRSTIIGDAIANIKAATGWKVLRDNHLGDWGTQFGKLICAIKKNWIPLDQIESADNPVKLLVELYVRFHHEAETETGLEDEARLWFKKLEDGDAEAQSIWQKCIDWSWKEFDRIYQLLNISFATEFNQGRGLGESFFEDKMAPVIQELEQRGFLETGELGAKVVTFNQKYPPLMILKKDGATLYSTRDLATDKYRKDVYHPDLILNEVGSEQSLYFNQIFDIEYRLGWFEPGQRVHVGHGMYRFKEGKMSTRKGNVIWLEEVIAKAIEKSKQFTTDEKLASDIAIGALKWNDLKGEAKRDITFDWDEILSMKGNSGPYVQYTYARTNSILDKANASVDPLSNSTELNLEEWSLLRWLLQFPEVVQASDTTNNPSQITTYLYELCQRFNLFYNKHTILGKNQPVSHRLSLTQLTHKTIKTGLDLLNIAAPARM
jgi:arginyl-tRNA synthetase